MNAEMELHAAQALYAARLFEAAIHDYGPWTMRWGSVEVPVVKEVNEEGVLFRGEFPDACWLNPPEDGLVLLLRGEVRGIKRVDHPGDTAFRVTWAVYPRVLV